MPYVQQFEDIQTDCCRVSYSVSHLLSGNEFIWSSLSCSVFDSGLGYWHQKADERHGNPAPS